MVSPIKAVVGIVVEVVKVLLVTAAVPPLLMPLLRTVAELEVTISTEKGISTDARWDSWRVALAVPL